MRITKALGNTQRVGLELSWDSEQFSPMSLRTVKVGGYMASDPESAAKNLCARVRPKGTFSWTAREGERSEGGAGIVSIHGL